MSEPGETIVLDAVSRGGDLVYDRQYAGRDYQHYPSLSDTLTLTIRDNDGQQQGSPGTESAQGSPGTEALQGSSGTARPVVALTRELYELIQQIEGWRDEPALSGHRPHVVRWNRVLLAFGWDVSPTSDSSIEPMTAAEAQTYADRGWQRWVPVAKALRGIEAAQALVVTIAGGGPVTEGTAAEFTLRAATAPAADLAVNVTVTQRGAFADAAALGARTVTIPAGGTSAAFTVATVDDTAGEADGAVVARLGPGAGYTVGAVATATVTVADNDELQLPPDIVTKRATAREGTDSAAVFTVRLSRAAPGPVTVDYATANGAGARTGSFREEVRDGPHPDHCAISVAIADGPPGSQRTRVALGAWTAAFARTSTDQIAGSIERRLARGAGSFATPGAAGPVRDDGSTDLASMLFAGAFQLSSGHRIEGSRWTLWGAGTTGSMPASEQDLRGRVRTATLGADVERGPATLGLALSHSRGRGSTAPTGPIEAELSSIAPYAAIVPREGVRLWATVGRGEGELQFEPAEEKPVRTDLETTLGALGFRAELGETYAVQWSTRASAALTAIETGRLADLDPIDSRAGRLRVGVDGLRRFELHDAAVLTPSVGLGFAHDVGEDASGTALELEAGLHYASPDGRLGAGGHVKGYLGGDDAGGWEVGGQLLLRPYARERGLSITLAPTWGAGPRESAPSAAEAWNVAQTDSTGRLRMEVAYGLALGGGRGTLIPYGGADWTGDDAHATRLGARWRWSDALSARFEGDFDGHGNGSGPYAIFVEIRAAW